MTLDLTDPHLGITAPDDLPQLPLVFGCRVEACAFTYLVLSPRQIRIKHDWIMSATEDWPYPDYPRKLHNATTSVSPEGDSLGEHTIEPPDDRGFSPWNQRIARDL